MQTNEIVASPKKHTYHMWIFLIAGLLLLASIIHSLRAKQAVAPTKLTEASPAPIASPIKTRDEILKETITPRDGSFASDVMVEDINYMLEQKRLVASSDASPVSSAQILLFDSYGEIYLVMNNGDAFTSKFEPDETGDKFIILNSIQNDTPVNQSSNEKIAQEYLDYVVQTLKVGGDYEEIAQLDIREGYIHVYFSF